MFVLNLLFVFEPPLFPGRFGLFVPFSRAFVCVLHYFVCFDLFVFLFNSLVQFSRSFARSRFPPLRFNLCFIFSCLLNMPAHFLGASASWTRPAAGVGVCVDGFVGGGG